MKNTSMNFNEALQDHQDYPLRCYDIENIQVNLGYLCNKECSHCHIRAGPDRTEVMNWKTMQAVIKHADQIHPKIVDITGGAPEMNPNLKKFIVELTKHGHPVQVRTNLIALIEREDLIQEYKNNSIKLVASLPCYEKAEVDSVRGEGTFSDSINMLKKLNSNGYGTDSKLQLDLVFNPEGSFLPSSQKKLEKAYKTRLQDDFGLVFNNLLTITNMPVGRFEDKLRSDSSLDEYMKLLTDNYNPKTIQMLMCRTQISVDYDGTLYDCDFNLANKIPLKNKPNINDENLDLNDLKNRNIIVGSHCFGCTAGEGSSCSGALIS